MSVLDIENIRGSPNDASRRFEQDDDSKATVVEILQHGLGHFAKGRNGTQGSQKLARDCVMS
eukprot:CAMPEP_0119025564 /NCGR_PEP_ID=MMETSP1176-20130426/33957_1 /TAXON_ID=265551 /ORGANISM="Synedropsis recta cf, Strain CCMP1620" /LENGTH=61 /DNA_ID=CAMNT_0006981125 /DNA_START=116 /DNA_END=298 /DNA_ORIENTATION=+